MSIVKLYLNKVSNVVKGKAKIAGDVKMSVNDISSENSVFIANEHIGVYTICFYCSHILVQVEKLWQNSSHMPQSYKSKLLETNRIGRPACLKDKSTFSNQCTSPSYLAFLHLPKNHPAAFAKSFRALIISPIQTRWTFHSKTIGPIMALLPTSVRL